MFRDHSGSDIRSAIVRILDSLSEENSGEQNHRVVRKEAFPSQSSSVYSLIRNSQKKVWSDQNSNLGPSVAGGESSPTRPSPQADLTLANPACFIYTSSAAKKSRDRWAIQR